jgi:H+/Na+-translocating ferredoxin:NAD+ oxidoreductase subunit G
VNRDRSEILRIAATMTVVCALAGAILGAGFLVTHRYREAADRRAERRAILDLLQLDSSATVLEIRQYLAAAENQVVYRTAPLGGRPEREIVFGLDGRQVSAGLVPAGAAGARGDRVLTPLGRMFAATRAGAPAGFVVEGETRGYKNKIRFFIGLTPDFEIAGVRVVEHEEDPGLGAEVATRAFQGQFVGRAAAALGTLDVTRDPMPEDWRAALAQLARTSAAQWRAAHADLVARENPRPIYAVTGATISSRALTDGVRATIERFRRRWELLESARGAAPAAAAVREGTP